MSFSHRISVSDNKSAKETAKLTNERRKQAQAWLRRNKVQKKQFEAIKK
jgi:hypothetical protein